MIKETPYSNLKVLTHHKKLDDISNNRHTAPIYVRLKPTNVCNHKCYYCSYADETLGLRDEVKKADQISWEKMKEIIGDLGDLKVKAITLSGGGEPLVYPKIRETMELILNRGIDLSIITNGELLSGEIAETLSKAKWVRISFDSQNAETYSKTRGIKSESFDRVCTNIKNFANIKSLNCELGVNFVVNHENCDQVYDMAKMVKDLGVNHIKYTARITKDLEEYHGAFKQQVIEQIHRAEKELIGENFRIINKYEDDFEFSTVFNRTYSKCYVKEFITVIAADSKVYFCHDKAYVSTGVVGDLKTKSFKEIWNSKEVQERYEKFDAEKECCHHCVFDDRNILLNKYFSLDENHINFI